MTDFVGSYTVMITPFTEDGSAIDTAALARFLDWQLEVGVPGIIVLGSTGEFLTVTDDERTQLVDATIKHINGRIPVLVGSMNAHTPNAVRYSREAERLGADGLMIVPPYYYTPTEDEIFGYYKAISESVEIPIMLYNNPVTSNVDMSAKLVGKLTRRLREHPLHQGSEPRRRAGLRRDRGDRGRDARLRRRAHRRVVPARGRRLREPVRQLHPARLVPHLGLPRRGPDRGRQEGAAPDQRDRPHHRRGASDVRAPVLLEGPVRRRPATRSATCARRSRASRRCRARSAIASASSRR